MPGKHERYAGIARPVQFRRLLITEHSAVLYNAVESLSGNVEICPGSDDGNSIAETCLELPHSHRDEVEGITWMIWPGVAKHLPLLPLGTLPVRRVEYRRIHARVEVKAFPVVLGLIGAPQTHGVSDSIKAKTVSGFGKGTGSAGSVKRRLVILNQVKHA